MTIPIKPKNLTNIIAYEGDKIEIPDSTAPDSGQPSIASGWPRITSLPVTAGGVAPSREGFNGLFNLLSQHLFYQQSGCLYSWSDKLSYPIGAVIKGSNGAIYIATANSGVDYAEVGAKDPISSPTFWAPLLVGNAVPVTAGGTGANSPASARANLGVGTAGTLTAGTATGQVPVYGAGQTITGNVSGTAKTITDTLTVAVGGTGATSAAAARTNLGVGTAGTKDAGTAAGQVPVYGAGQTIQGNVSGTAANITGVVAVANGGTGRADGAPKIPQSGITWIALSSPSFGVGFSLPSGGFWAFLLIRLSTANTIINIEAYTDAGGRYISSPNSLTRGFAWQIL